MALTTALALVAAACGGDDETKGEGFVFGMILVGPQDDRGWSQAHLEGGRFVEAQLGATMIVLDSVNPAARPETTVEQVVDDMIDQGAELIFATSDDMKDGILAAADQHPDVPMIWSSGDSAWADGKAYRADLANLGNVMGRMEFGKMIAGCSAALTTQTGQIGYLGPLINDETRRLANSAYLGAQYCWENFRGQDPATLGFEVNWIGFWFNIPGVTLDPTQVANEFFDSGADVVISGIDTTEGLVRAGQRAGAGEAVWAVPYDFVGACAEAPEICLGVPWFNWGPAYRDVAEAVIDGDFQAEWQWVGPDWSDLNNPEKTGIGFIQGDALTPENAKFLEDFIGGLGDRDIKLFVGPLNYQDGSVFLGSGEEGTDFQIWYSEQLLEGMKGASSS
ncbi:MAG: BMP family protein [Acidimicrobiia bacterium]